MKFLRSALGIPLLALLAVSCASRPATPAEQFQARIEHYSQRIRDVVEDPARAQQMLDTLDAAEASLETVVKQLEEEREQLIESSRSYEVTDEELERTLRSMQERMLAMTDQLEDAHFALRDLATEEEWSRLIRPSRSFLGIF